MTKRLCDLVDLIENNKDCAVFAFKEGVTSLDLIRLGGFRGDETMFRISKDMDAVSLTVFRNGETPSTLNMGSRGVSHVTPDTLQMRESICECVNLDFGIVTGGNSTIRANSRWRFDELVEETSGKRDLNSLRSFELITGAGGNSSLFVNDQHICHLHIGDMDQWLAEKHISMERHVEERGSSECLITRGEFKHVEAERQMDKSHEYNCKVVIHGEVKVSSDKELTFNQVFEAARKQIEATDTTGTYQVELREVAVCSKDSERASAEVSYLKDESVSDLTKKAKERATERNNDRSDFPSSIKETKTPGMER